MGPNPYSHMTMVSGSTMYPQVTFTHTAHCPDLLRYEQIGAADNMRGRVVRAFFWIMRAWPV